MRVVIQDKVALQSLGPQEISAYLRSNGWREDKVLPKRGAFWVLERKKDSFEVALPFARSTPDYAIRIAEMLKTLEVVEERSQLDILRDLTTASADVLRLTANYSQARDGSLPVDDGVEFIQHARDLVLAAACAATDPRPVFQTRKPTQAIEYMKCVRLGQTERGSYAINIVSPVAPQVAPALFDGIDDPFERIVSLTLMDAIEAANQDIAKSGRPDKAGIQKAIQRGVSANFCEALAGLGKYADPDRGLLLDVTWARSRPVSEDIPRRQVVPSDAFPILREFGRVLRETRHSVEPTVVQGVVIKLDRGPGDIQGKATIYGLVDDKMRQIRVELTGDLYRRAIEAHQDRLPVESSGLLVRQGRLFVLQDPRQFDVLTDDAKVEEEPAPNLQTERSSDPK